MTPAQLRHDPLCLRWPNAVSEHGFPRKGEAMPASEPSPFQLHAFKGKSKPPEKTKMAKTPEQLTRDWLAKHDAKRAPAQSPRFERWQKRKKAREQAREQERRELATPLLKGVT
jgi:hypothetical protein